MRKVDSLRNYTFWMLKQRISDDMTRGHRPVNYIVGELACFFTPVRKVGLSEKFLRRYFGPYRITRRLSYVTCKVQSMEVSTKYNEVKRRSPRPVVETLLCSKETTG
ncbi:hypothetical protein AVEN_202319-1 [Araneus ventricosus]|uniref:Uncharacterized protein n=1 Tax=Araneus ventricosus TaxID=182803 RepID=A0A4Y2E5A1_ARAVE|nr:hypothetical protein AVEN_202319-1 [Araneus ventricosus]